MFLGALVYADDVILLSPTLHALNKMFTVANQFSKVYDITFNHFTPKLLRLIFQLVRTPNIFSCTKLEMNLV